MHTFLNSMRIYHNIRTVLFLSVFSIFTTRVHSTCPLNYYDVGSKCVHQYIGSRLQSQREAVAACSIMNSKLLEITDQQTQMELVQWLSGMRDGTYWIGLDDISSRHGLKWRNGTYARYMSWADGYPKYNHDENCVVMSGRHGYNWVDVGCQEKHMFICETPHQNRISDLLRIRNFALTFDLQDFCSTVPLGYYAYPLNCKKYVLCFAPYSKYNSIYSCGQGQYYNHKKRRCERPSTDFQCLVQSTTTVSTTVVTTTTTTAKPITTPEVTTAPSTTQTTTTEDFYYPGPEFDGENDDQGVVDYNEVPTIPDYGTDSIIEIDYSTAPEEITSSPYECEDKDYVLFRDTCYSVRDIQVPWEDAKLLCATEGGQLGVIKSSEEQMFIEKQLQKIPYTFNFWIGLSDEKRRGKFVWVDDTPLKQADYNNWMADPSDDRVMRECIVMTKIYNYKWEGSLCSNRRSYVCQKGAVAKTEVEEYPDEYGQDNGDGYGGDYIDGDNTDVGSDYYDPIDPLMIPPLAPVAPVVPMKPRNEYCGSTRKPGVGKLSAVIGGKVASKNTHPWQVSLRLRGEHMCGGSLIDDCWVLTAAHCVDESTIGLRRQPTVVVAGDHDRSKIEGTEQYLLIEEVIIHPNWKLDSSPKNDIALMRLKVCAKDLNPICLPRNEFESFGAGSQCKVSGWGTMDPAKDITPAELQEAIVPILDHDECESAYMKGRESLLTDNMLCAGYMDGNVDACDGDSGGPLGCVGIHSPNVIQWGIVSWGHGCAKANKPGVYTKVINFMDWVREITNIDF